MIQNDDINLLNDTKKSGEAYKDKNKHQSASL